MPRVSTRTRKRKEVKRPMRCAACGQEIQVGDTYYTWARKTGRSGAVYFQHKGCGYPKRSQLSSRKTVAIEDAIDEAGREIAVWSPVLDDNGSYSDGYEPVTNALNAVAEVGREVGQEYQDGFDNMPEGLNQGATAQAMEEVTQELESWADDLDSWSPPGDEPEFPARADFIAPAGTEYDEDAYREACELALDDWADEVRSAAEDAMSEMPEYQG
jgi:hypothetical protein